MKKNCPLPLMLILILFTAANIPAQDARVKALEGTWVVTTIKNGDEVIDEVMMAELGIEILFIFENNMMLGKATVNGETNMSPTEKIEVDGTTIKADDGSILPYTLENDTLTLIFPDGGMICKRRP
ncbi:MAG: hypothetical protein LBQ46_13025 [Treponema sp.]|jgi:hypothetical protein|nr:hypothetical protein [Treponema sp.]